MFFTDRNEVLALTIKRNQRRCEDFSTIREKKSCVFSDLWRFWHQ